MSAPEDCRFSQNVKKVTAGCVDFVKPCRNHVENVFAVRARMHRHVFYQLVYLILLLKAGSNL